MLYKIRLDKKKKWRVMQCEEWPNGQLVWKAISPPYSKRSFAILWGVKHNILKPGVNYD